MSLNSLVNQSFQQTAKLDKLVKYPPRRRSPSCLDLAPLFPHQRKEGSLQGVDWEGNRDLKRLEACYGRAVADLLIEKRREIEEHNPSGHYPTTVSA